MQYVGVFVNKYIIMGGLERMPMHLCMFGCKKRIMTRQLPWFLLSFALIPYPSENLQTHLSVLLNMFYDMQICMWMVYACVRYI